MRYLLFLSLACSVNAWAQGPFENCVEAYYKKAGAYGDRARSHDLPKPLLSYQGPRVISYDGTLFENWVGELPITVQEVSEQDELTELNAALVAEFMTAASNDYDYEINQLMALQLRTDFPNLSLDTFTYWSISELEENESGLFCRKGKLWTWKQIRNWLRTKAIPKKLKETDPKLLPTQPVCRETLLPEGLTLVCTSD